jgi:hypothetical protein
VRRAKLKQRVALLAMAPFLLSGNLHPAPATGSIDLSHYRLTFAEDFNDLSVSPWGDGHSRWIAHTPWAGDFGDAAFTDPEPGFPSRSGKACCGSRRARMARADGAGAAFGGG